MGKCDIGVTPSLADIWLERLRRMNEAMSEFAQRIQILQQRLYQEEGIEDLLTLLQEIEILVAEHPTRESYDLLTRTYRSLYSATSEDSDLTRELILQRLLPWLIEPETDENAEYARSSCRSILRDWLNQYPEENRQRLLQPILSVLAYALHTQPTIALCWTISVLGYRHSDLVTGLWTLVNHGNDQLVDVALLALAQLGVQEPDRQRLLKKIHQRVIVDMSTPLLSALDDLADVSTIPVIRQWLISPQLSDEENEILLVRMLALRVLTSIANAHNMDVMVQEVVWSTIAVLYEAVPDDYAFAIYLGDDIASACNHQRVPLDLIRWLEKHSEKSEKDKDRRRLLYLRLAECVRPQQLAGVRWSRSSKALILIRRDARHNSGNTSRWSTQESYIKQRAWDTLLFLGDDSVLSSLQFKKAVGEEVSGYVRGEIMELLACFHWRHLPEEVVAWITERVDLHQDTASQELPFRRGAEHLARSAGTRQAFDALLAFGMTFDGEASRDTVDALASVSLALARKGEQGIVEALLETMEYGEEARYRTAAMQALARIAGNDLFPSQYLPRIIAMIEDEKRGDFELSRLVHILGMMPRASIVQSTLDILQNLARSGPSLMSTSAMEALARYGVLLDMPELLEKRLSLHAVGEQWECQPTANMSRWMVGMVCTLYGHDPKRFALVVATLLQKLSLFELPLLLRALDEIHSSEHRPIPEEVQAALLSQLGQLRDEVFTTPTGLLQTCARLFPNDFAEQAWDRQWKTWRPEMRETLAEVLGRGLYTTERAQGQSIKHLLLLTHDAQYKVRRVAYRSLVAPAPRHLLQASVAWTYSPMMELRRRAAEALSWLSPTAVFGSEVDALVGVLALDPDPLVREALERSKLEGRQRVWAGEYLTQVRSAYGKSNKVRLAIWCYAHALTVTGDDTTIANLNADLASSDLAPHERQWLLWMIKNTQEHWKKSVDKWPEPWFTWTGHILFERGQVTLGTNATYDGTFFLYQEGSSDGPLQHASGGSFWPDTSMSVPQHRTMTLLLADGRRSQATIKETVSSNVCLLENVGSFV